MGSKRTGSYPHVDPRSTSAWNWLLHGNKRWCLFPPTVDPRDIGVVVVSSGAAEGEGEEEKEKDGGEGGGGVAEEVAANGAAFWWATHYPRLRAAGVGAALGMVECLQAPGEVIYVPQGWWHAVLNVSDWTTAVTHNLVMGASLPSAFAREAAKDPAYASRWYRCLQAFDAPATAALDAQAPAAVAAALRATGTAPAPDGDAQLEDGGCCEEHELLASYRLVDSLLALRDESKAEGVQNNRRGSAKFSNSTEMIERNRPLRTKEPSSPV